MSSRSRYQRQFGGSSSGRRPNISGASHNPHSSSDGNEQQQSALLRARRSAGLRAEAAALDAVFGFEEFSWESAANSKPSSKADPSSVHRRGWVFNILPVTLPASEAADEGGFAGGGEDDGGGAVGERSALELFLIDEEQRRFKATLVYEPYFYVLPETPPDGGGPLGSSQDDLLDLEAAYQELTAALLRLYRPLGLNRIQVQRKMDLDANNHLGIASQTLGGRPVLKLVFDNTDQLGKVKSSLAEVLRANRAKHAQTLQFMPEDRQPNKDPMDTVQDIREHDVPYVVRACIDLDLRAGCWYTLTPLKSGGVALSLKDNLQKANPKVLAFDIECTKAPLKFPDADVDSIFMISYMMDGQGYLLLSRHVVGDDVNNFEYTPKPKYPGPFIVMNELTEEALIRRFITEFQNHGPQIVVTYNGDFFDWPFLEKRAAVYGLDLRREIGFYNAGGDNSSEYRGRTAVHLDAFCWVKRDSYLPQGSQGLKAVTKYKLGYDPVEVDPEDMVRYARDRPSHMASYSVSDAVATYYLYDKYVHMFIFSLCTIIPMGPEDVLRKGSGESELNMEETVKFNANLFTSPSPSTFKSITQVHSVKLY
jgi:DNA polymerase epsilon subunit 1